MMAKELMEIDLHIELLLGETAISDRKFLMDEFDCEDGLWSIKGRCFLDA